MSMDYINLFLHCLLLLPLLSRNVFREVSSFIYAPHLVTQVLKTGPRCPRLWSLWERGHTYGKLRHNLTQDVKLRFILGTLWIYLNVQISLYILFSVRIGNKNLANVCKNILS